MTTLRICFVGDSITIGTHDKDFLGWPGRLCAAENAAGHDISLYNLGVRAHTSVDIAQRWRAECEARLPEPHPGALVFSFGVNDAAEELGKGIRVPVEVSVATARAILSEAGAWKPTLWIGPSLVDEDRQPFVSSPTVTYRFSNRRVLELSAAYGVVAADLGIPYLDMASRMAEDTAWSELIALGDSVHPTERGYVWMAKAISEWSPWREWFDRQA